MHKNNLRFFLKIIIIAAVSALLLSHTVHAATCGGVNTSVIECTERDDGGIFHILALVINIFSIGVGILGVIGISWAGTQYITAGGSEEKATKAKRRIYEIILGLVCYAVLWAGLQWLLPGGVLNTASNDAEESPLSILYDLNKKKGTI